MSMSEPRRIYLSANTGDSACHRGSPTSLWPTSRTNTGDPSKLPSSPHIDCTTCWMAAARISDPQDLAWVTDERLGDVVVWLHRNWCGCSPLDDVLRVALNEGLPALPDDSDVGDIRRCIPHVAALVQEATGLRLTDPVYRVLALGVITADQLFTADTGKGPAILPLHRLDRVRDTNGNRGGGLRRDLARQPGVAVHEAVFVSRILLGTPLLDERALPIRYGALQTQLGASSALICGVLGVEAVALSTARAWAPWVRRAIDPAISFNDMRREVTTPLVRMATDRKIHLRRTGEPSVVRTLGSPGAWQRLCGRHEPRSVHRTP